jgi:hypothetical protein
MTRVPNADVFAALLRDAALSDAEVSARLDRACDPAYWRGLTSDVSLLDTAPTLDTEAVGDAAIQSAGATMRDEGVFHLPPVLAAGSLRRINAAIDAVVAEGWPPAFVFVYDQPWLCARIPQLLQVVTHAFGEGCLQIPNVWTHRVQPRRGAAGWAPHLDGPPAAQRITVWIALTAATLENGCMYVVPRSAVPPEVSARPVWLPNLTGREALKMLHGARAMPASAGEVLGWCFEILHWGSPMTADGAERRAFSLEFIAAGEEPVADERPLLDLTGPLPSFTARLRAIAAPFDNYSRMEFPLIRFARFATTLLERLDCQESQ